MEVAALDHLMAPIKLGNLQLANRVALGPMGLGLETADETWPERYFPFIEERCRGEAGLIITHFTNATRIATHPLVGIYDNTFLDTHRRLTEIVHRYESKVFLQLAAFGGRLGDAGPSAVESPCYPRVPRELTVEEIKRIVRDFGESGARARSAGYDGVELHGGYLYLVGAFISPHTNRRSDEYGGDLAGRMRFAAEIVEAIRHEAGADYPVGFKFSAWEEIQGGVDLQLGARIAECMAAEGVCYLHVASSSTDLGLTSRYPSVPTMYAPANCLLPLSKLVKDVAGRVPVMAAGAIGDPIAADAMIARGECDLVAVARAFLADPHWARKARLGEPIRPCIRCNVCYEPAPHAAVVCTVNPYVTLEGQEPLQPIARRKKLMVIGGGPGGMVAALTASRRGHDVTLYEKRDALGGELIPASSASFKTGIARLLQYWREEVADSAIDVRLKVEVTAMTVRANKPDAVIVAIGATGVTPAIPGVQRRNVMNCVDALLDPHAFSGKRVVIIGGGELGLECAIFLAETGSRVTVVEKLEALAANAAVQTCRADLLRMVVEAGVGALTGVQVAEIQEDVVRVRDSSGAEISLDADFVIIAAGMSPMGHLAHQLAAECPDVRIIGDCREPRRIRDAVVEGDLAGRLV